MIGDIIDSGGGTRSRPTRWPATSALSSAPWPEASWSTRPGHAAAFGLAAAVLSAAAVLGFVSPETRPEPAHARV